MRRRYCNIICLMALVVCVLTGCGNNGTDTSKSIFSTTKTTKEEKYQIALVMDYGHLNDRSFNQGTWEGMQKYCDANQKTYKYYTTKGEGNEAYEKTISKAIDSGAEVVVCPGYLFEIPVYDMQKKYPDVKFILIDGEPHNEDSSKYDTSNNTMPILYKEDQAGFLAGYAAVKDGSTKLGFMGGVELPAVIRYGYGYLQGAEYAAEELNISKVEVNYTYTGSFSASDEAQTLCSDWYHNGAQVIFGCGGLVGNSVMLAAELSESGKVIGVDVDQSQESITVMTSAMKMISNSVYDALTSAYDGTFVGGKTKIFTIANDGVGIEMNNSRFQIFTDNDYNKVYKELVSGKINVNVNIKNPLNKLKFKHLAVTEVKMSK